MTNTTNSKLNEVGNAEQTPGTLGGRTLERKKKYNQRTLQGFREMTCRGKDLEADPATADNSTWRLN